MTQQVNNVSYPTYGSLALNGYVQDAKIIQFPSHENVAANVLAPAANVRSGSVLLGIFMVVTAVAIASVTIVSAVVARTAYSNAVASITTSEAYVRNGDTLWSIAQRHSVDGMTTEQVVEWLEAENGLESATINPGQVLVVPA